jgi:cytochrome c biogenesis protein CcmG/thiol:disulfide interchange protein DsbE
MRDNSKISQYGHVLVASFLAVVLLTACADGNQSHNQSLNGITNGAMAASSRLSSDLPKSANPHIAQEKIQKKRSLNTEAKETTPPDQAAPMEPQLDAAPSQPTDQKPAEEFQSTTSLPEVTLPLEAQAQSLPGVDLSIPAEPKVGFRAPDFTLQTIDGRTLQLADLLGRPLVINYWTTWCVPCKQEMPILEELNKEYAAKGIVFLSVNAIDQDSLDKVQALVAEMGLSFPVMLDKGHQFADEYQAIFFPTTFIVDAKGVIREVNLGDSTEEELRSSLERLLAGAL